MFSQFYLEVRINCVTIFTLSLLYGGAKYVNGPWCNLNAQTHWDMIKLLMNSELFVFKEISNLLSMFNHKEAWNIVICFSFYYNLCNLTSAY